MLQSGLLNVSMVMRLGCYVNGYQRLVMLRWLWLYIIMLMLVMLMVMRLVMLMVMRLVMLMVMVIYYYVNGLLC